MNAISNAEPMFECIDEYIDVDSSSRAPDIPIDYSLDAAELHSFAVQIAAGMVSVWVRARHHRVDRHMSNQWA
jgi:hypothetical protein